MKSFMSKNKKLLAVLIIGLFIFSSGVAFAYTSQGWVVKATAWANTNCLSPSKADAQKAFLCYLWVSDETQRLLINRLQHSVNEKSTQIEKIQAKTKSIWVYDQNNKKLGLYAGTGIYNNPGNTEEGVLYFYDTISNRLVKVTNTDTSTYEGFTGETQNRYLAVLIGYSNSNCTGQAYIMLNGNSEVMHFYSLVFRDKVNEFYILPDKLGTLTMDAVKYTKNEDGACVEPDYGPAHGFAVDKIVPSFPAQVALPLIFKYE